MFPATEQDRIDIRRITEIVANNAKLKKALEGPTKWVGEVGFNECVRHLSKKRGITNAKKLCGYLKGAARSKGVLKKEHMGRLERKRAKAKGKK